MKAIYFILLVFLSTSYAFAEPICQVCDNGVEEIALFVRSYDSYGSLLGSTYHTELRDYAKAMENLKVILPMKTVKVSSPEELRSTFVELAKGCKRIRYLRFAGHGHPGAFFFRTYKDLVSEDSLPAAQMTSIRPANIRQTLAGLSCVMAPQARIDFRSCETGQGCIGQRFMELLTYYLLPKGGVLRAATQIEFVPPSLKLLPLFPLIHLGEPQYLSVSHNFQSLRWRPALDSNCQQPNREERKTFEALVQHVNSCHEQLQKELRPHLIEAEVMLNTRDRLASSYSGFPKAQEVEMLEMAQAEFNFYESFNQKIQYVKKILSISKPCENREARK